VLFVTRLTDAAVIGAGHNGLVAANVLADAGWSVVVYEAEAEPGGGTRSGEPVEPGFVHDHCASFFPLGAASPVFRRLRIAPPWRHGPLVLAHPAPDGSCPVLARGGRHEPRLVEGCVLHTDAPLRSLAGHGVGRILVEAGRRYGMPCIEGGAGTLTRLLLERALARGVDVRLGTRLTALPAARRAVLAAVDIWELGRLTGRPSHVRPDPATLKVDWSLDGPVPWAAEPARRSPVVHIGGPGRFSIVGQYSMADPTRAPAGKEALWGYTHDLPSAEALEEAIEELAPGFRALIRQRRAEWLPPGRVSGGTMRRLLRHGPWVREGVYLASMSAFPGGGVHGVPGWIAAQAALRSARSPLRRARRPDSFRISST
jgi:phytoene dehydrogenase-like protein